MCGIHGIVQFNKKITLKDQEKVNLMLKIAKHRGPDQSDAMILNQAVLGTNRLAIISPTEHSTIQLTTDEKEYALFNGEIVNYKNLRRLLKYPPKNHHTDSAIILPLFKQFGPNFIKKLAGMFAIAIYNKQKNSLQLWRDPLGVKPLYYYQSKEEIIFSSEIKAIYAVLEHTPKLDFAALDDSLKYRFHPGQSTVFPEIKRVLPGETVIFKNGKVIRKQFWTLTPNKKSLNKNISVEQFRTLLIDVVKENAQADVKGGFFVSGGLDSSLITSIGLKLHSAYQQPISIKFTPNPVVDESYGKLLERYLKTKFEWVEISDAIARQALMELTSFIDEPLENPIHIGTYLMAKRAKELGIKSVLTGDGSDEFFLGYARHACWFNNPQENPSIAYPKWLWTLGPQEAKELYTTEANASVKPMIDAFNQRVEPFLNVNQALRFERLDRLSEYHNMRLDRMTMANGVEAKVPFLDHRIVEYALQIPLSKLFGSTGKGWLQEVAKPMLPIEILNRPKVHFPSLPDQWLSGKGADWTAEILLDHKARTRKWIKPKILEKYIKEHKKGTRGHGRLFWALVVLELWLQNLIKWRSKFDEQ